MTRWMSVPDGPDTTLIKQRNKTTKKQFEKIEWLINRMTVITAFDGDVGTVYLCIKNDKHETGNDTGSDYTDD